MRDGRGVDRVRDLREIPESCVVGVPNGTSALSRVVKESIVGAREETRRRHGGSKTSCRPRRKCRGTSPPNVAAACRPVAAAVPTIHGNGGSRTAASSGEAPTREAPTRCLTLKNMFDPAQMGDGGDNAWWVDIDEEVREECAKHRRA